MRLVSALCAAVLIVAANPSRAQTPRCYLLVSEIAREVAVVTCQPAVGSRVDQNLQQRMPIPGAVLDRAALARVQTQIRLREPQTRRVTLLAPG